VNVISCSVRETVGGPVEDPVFRPGLDRFVDRAVGWSIGGAVGRSIHRTVGWDWNALGYRVRTIHPNAGVRQANPICDLVKADTWAGDTAVIDYSISDSTRRRRDRTAMTTA
jgi:hypothetical protein